MDEIKVYAGTFRVASSRCVIEMIIRVVISQSNSYHVRVATIGPSTAYLFSSLFLSHPPLSFLSLFFFFPLLRFFFLFVNGR